MPLHRRGHRFVRYADDFRVLVKSERAGQRGMASLTRFLKRKLRLTVNPQKSKVVPLNQCRFLGFRFNRKRIGEVAGAIPAVGQGTDWPQLGRGDGLPITKALGVSPGVDGILCAVGILQPGAGTR